jgi:hypothetical protein
MKSRSTFLCVLTFLIATAACAQTSGSKDLTAAPESSPIVGVWRAQADGLPFVTLTITNESGSLSGAILFYLHRREEGKPVTSTPGIPEPLFNLNFDGKILTFQVSHRRAHPPRTLSDPPVNFRLKLTGANAAGVSMGNLTNESEGSPAFPMVRTDY